MCPHAAWRAVGQTGAASRIDYDRCKSHGQCQIAAPEVFAVRDDGYMYILIEQIDDSLRSACEDAVDACPEQALRIEG